jgi:hypothetical protein
MIRAADGGVQMAVPDQRMRGIAMRAVRRGVTDPTRQSSATCSHDAVIYFKDSPDLPTADAANGAAAALVDLARLGRSFRHLRCHGAPGRTRGVTASPDERLVAYT